MSEKDKMRSNPDDQIDYRGVDCSTLETEVERVACKVAQDRHMAKEVQPNLPKEKQIKAE